MADAKQLHALKQKLAADPSNASLEASVKLFASFGMGQREAPGFDELKKLAATEGLDAGVAKRWKTASAEMEFEAYLNGLRSESASPEAAFDTAYQDWVKGRRPPTPSAGAGVNYIFMATKGAVAAKNVPHAKELYADLMKAVEAAGIPEARHRGATEPLKKAIADLEK